jgi:hypothetical protein
MLINPYVPGIPFKNFPNLDADISKHYDRVYDTVFDFKITTRYIFELGLKIGFRDMFYYIDQLYTNSPTSVIDVGCGECTWKKWMPNIVGFDSNFWTFSNKDFTDHFNKYFSKDHTKQYDCGMALNSLHFVDWDVLSNQIDLAMNMVKDRFFFTFNFMSVSNRPTKSISEMIILFDDIIKSLDYEIVLLDYPSLRGVPEDLLTTWAHVNGHVRFILMHKNI